MPQRLIGWEGGREPFCDGLLWIGGSYRSIECGSAESCAVPVELAADRGQAKCFVHEAEWRGISRKIPGVPKWAVPGKTRIFLVHRDGMDAACGRIFGYFVLHRVEVLSEADTALAPPDVQQVLPWSGSRDEDKKDKGELTVRVYDAVTGRPLRGASVQAEAGGEVTNVVEISDQVCRLGLPTGEHRLVVSMKSYKPTALHGIRVPSGKRRKVAVYLQPDVREVVTAKEGEERTEKCLDGSTIVTHRFVDGKWRRTRQRCPALPAPPKCEDGALKWSVCPDGTLLPVRICLGGEWRDTGVRCTGSGKVGPSPTPSPQPIDPGGEVFLPHRSCSLRLRPGAVYLVDALCAEINDRFTAALQTSGLPARYKTAEDDGHRWDLVLAGRTAFRKIASEMSRGWRCKASVPSRLAKRVENRGELVLFNDPVTFVRKPRASFRGLERIDGDGLLQQIADGVREPEIHVCVREAAKEPMLTKRQIAARLAEREKTTLAAAEGLLDVLAQDARRELGASDPGAVQLPGIGTLRAAASPASVSPANRDDLEKGLVQSLATAGTVLDGATVHRLLDHLAELAAQELGTAPGVFRLPRIGTLRCQGERLDFSPSQALGDAAVTFVPEGVF